MELNLTSEQSLLRDSAARFAGAAGPGKFANKAARAAGDGGGSVARSRLHEAGDLGWLGMLVPEAHGGLGLGVTELALVAEQTGRGLLGEPVALATVCTAALGQGAGSHPLLPQAIAGEVLIVPALEERAFDDDPLMPATTAVTAGSAVRLTGRKRFVCADGADGFLVSARAGDDTVLCLVARDAPGVSLDAIATVDGRRLWSLDLAGAPADVVVPRSPAPNAVAALHDLALIALAAELLGVMEEGLRITLDYLRIRKQFGKLIGSFQGLQHQAANLYLRTETVRSLIFQIAAGSAPFAIDPALAAAAKAKASEHALIVTKACIQLHGAIGFTDEHNIGPHLKRAMLLSSLMGNAAAQRRRYVALTGLAQ